MKIASDILLSYQSRKSSLTSLTYFFKAFSQFGLDERNAEVIVKGLFGGKRASTFEMGQTARYRDEFLEMSFISRAPDQ
jgi:UV DNA damage repair endonuclease